MQPISVELATTTLLTAPPFSTSSSHQIEQISQANWAKLACQKIFANQHDSENKND